MAAPVAYVNGDFVARDAARVSVMDRGLLFGDAVYEVIPVYAGQPFRLADHLQRLARSLEQIGIDDLLSEAGWQAMVHRLIADNGGGDLSVYLQVTRGAPDTRDHWPGTTPQPTVIAFTGAIHPPSPQIAADGVGIITRADPRWQRCDIKATALLPNVLARRDAAAAGAIETVFHRDGWITEGAATNVFAITDETIVTPPLGPHLLAGITRRAVLDYLAQSGHRTTEAPVSVDALRGADEVWLTSSMREIVPVTRIDDVPVGSGRPGSLWHTVAPGFSAWLRTSEATTPPTTLLEHG